MTAPRPAARYAFRDEWEVPAAPEAVREVVTDLERYPEWWPQVRAVASLGPDDAWVRCRSRLPYTLDLVLSAVSRQLPTLEVAISGQLHGHARWTLSPTPTGTRMTFAQEVVVRGLLVPASYVARPVLRWNHAAMMDGCRRGLSRRLGAPA